MPAPATAETAIRAQRSRVLCYRALGVGRRPRLLHNWPAFRVSFHDLYQGNDDDCDDDDVNNVDKADETGRFHRPPIGPTAFKESQVKARIEKRIMSTIIASGARALALAQPNPACFAFNSYPPPLPLPVPLPTLSTLSLSLSTLDENAIMPSPNSPRQSFSSCGASVRYTPRRRNALVPLPLLPPVPPHVVVKRIACVVCTPFPYLPHPHPRPRLYNR